MDFQLPTPVGEALARLREAGFSAYVVGGCVRDRVLGVPPHDYDICTSALPEETERVFRGERLIETGLQHGTVTVLLKGEPLEITTFRTDGAYLDGRHPASVSFTPQIEEDLARRDFTINAMAYAPGAGIVDPFGGQADCRRGIIRCVGVAKIRFGEDALRMLRALRFSARLGFPIEEQTAAAMVALKDHLQKISRERVASELGGLLLGKDAEGVMGAFAPVVFAAAPRLTPLCEKGLWEKTLRGMGRTPREEALRWAALLAPLGEEEARRTLLELKMPNRLTEAVATLIKWQDRAFAPNEMQEMLVYLGPERLGQLLSLQRALGESQEPEGQREAALQRLLEAGACCTLKQLAVKGGDLIQRGLRGPAIGEALNQLLLAVARGRVANEREALLTFAAQKQKENQP